ncbi:hypothetical protein [Demequina sp. NBRC 110055]|uniref:hypothetical protein n=1 Tax=Demequina sp. NBRC 110055 TaxID=1570344 RepID=UPI0009FD7DCC|nr:hypothetical protein [Demequina sp. NBRC 110055]
MTRESPLSSAPTRPVAAIVMALEAVALAAGAVAYAWHGIAGSDDPALTWSLVVMLAVLAVPLAAAAAAVSKGRRWGRSYGIMWQVLQLAAGWYLLEVSTAGAVATMVSAVVAGAALILETRADPQI